MAGTTFCYPDSVFEPRHFGVASRLSTLIAVAEADDTDTLIDYIEAHVHGGSTSAATSKHWYSPLLPRHPHRDRRPGGCRARWNGTADSD